MKIGSLFAGIGGFDLGFERQGFECLWQCEIDKYACQVLENHWPEVKRYNDIRELKCPEYVDVICGGFPCQDLSVAGNRAGLSGQRSGLFFELARIINEVKPKWFVLENVPGLLSSNGGKDMQTVLETLAKFGYYVAYRVFDSQNFGVAQRRKRVFFVGSLGNPGCVKVLFESESISINTSTNRAKKYQNPRMFSQDTSAYPIISLGPKDTLRFNNGIVPTLCAEYTSRRPSCVIKTANTKANGNNISTKGISYTLDGSVNQAIVQDKIRRLTPLEYERLQGFPDNWTDNLTDTQRYKTLGNAVTVNVIEWIAKRIKEVENETNPS